MIGVLKHILSVIVITIVLVSPAVAQPAISIAAMERGRDFGILIGDEITHRYMITASPDYVLTESSLPVESDLDYWLNLKHVRLEQEMNDEEHVYYLTLVYQTFYAPLDVRKLAIAPVRLDFTNTQNQQRTVITLPEWHFTMSPIKEVQSRGVGREGSTRQFMQDIINPELIKTKELQRYIWLSVSLFLFSLILFFWLSGWLPFMQRSPFVLASKAIRKQLKQQTEQQTSYQACLMLFHKALNRRAGFTVFVTNLDLLFAKHPQFKGLAEDLELVLMSSRKTFFLDEPVDSALINKTIQLCEKLAFADKV